MLQLDNEIKASKQNVLIKCMDVTQFYKFYKFIKGILPVMVLIGEKYEEKGINQKIEDLGLRESLTEEMRKE